MILCMHTLNAYDPNYRAQSNSIIMCKMVFIVLSRELMLKN